MNKGSTDRYDRGMQIRREVLGDDHVETASTRTTPLDEDFQRFLTETAWGWLWARPELDRRARSLVTIAILAALDREELDLHLRASANTGASAEEVVEVLHHVAIYAGVPAAHRAIARAKEILGGG